jgi:hypothetical protein
LAKPRQKPKAPNPATAWLDKRISLSVNDETLSDALRKVMHDGPVRGSGYNFDSEQKISVQVKNKTVREALGLVLRAASPKYAWYWDAKNYEMRFGYLPAIEAEMAAAAEKQRRDDAAHLAKLAASLEEADSVMIFLLDFSIEEPAEAMFPIRPYGSNTKIFRSKTFAANDVKPLLTALSATLTDKDGWNGGALCHFPVHGIRVYDKPTGRFGPSLLFESSFCWRCNNYYVTFPRPDFAEASRWRGIPAGPQLAKEFEKLLPVPQEELDRFKAKYGH